MLVVCIIEHSFRVAQACAKLTQRSCATVEALVSRSLQTRLVTGALQVLHSFLRPALPRGTKKRRQRTQSDLYGIHLPLGTSGGI